MAKNQTVSVIIPFYNSEAYLNRAIESVVNQTYTNWEIILIDDKSTDNSLKIAKKWVSKNKQIKLIVNKNNLGAAISRNIGIQNSIGRYIAFLDSDDWWEKDKLQIQIKVINKSAATLCYGNYSFTSLTENGLKIILKRVVVPITTTYRQLLKRSRIWTGTVLIDTKKIDRNQIRMPDIKIGEDLILWLSILKAGHKVIGVQKNLAFYWRTNKDKTLSSNKKEAALARWSIYYEFEKLGFFRSLYHMYFYVFDAIMRRF